MGRVVFEYLYSYGWIYIYIVHVYKHRDFFISTDIHLEGSLVLCPSNEILLISSPLGPVSSAGMNSWLELQYQAHVSSCGGDLKSK